MPPSRLALLLCLALTAASTVDAWGYKAPEADPSGKGVAVSMDKDSASLVKHEEEYDTWHSVNEYWYNENTGAVSLKDPLVDFHGHTTPDGHQYWTDPKTGEATWEVPEPFAWKAENSTEHEGHVYYFNTVTKDSTWEKPEILAWQTAEKGFWHNNVTGESTWKVPEALGHEAEGTTEKYWIVEGKASWEPPTEFAWRAIASTEPDHEGRFYYENWITKEVTWERPAALAWSRRSFKKTFWWNVVTGEAVREAPTDVFGFDDNNGNRFFVDPKTGESTWDRPEKAAWQEIHSDEHGRPYYYNNVTQEVVWERPAESNVAWIMYHEEL